jgi:hypothetical protein
MGTTKPHKHKRDPAAVFPSPATKEEIFLDNTLLKNHHAIRKDTREFRDLEKSWRYILDDKDANFQ